MKKYFKNKIKFWSMFFTLLTAAEIFIPIFSVKAACPPPSNSGTIVAGSVPSNDTSFFNLECGSISSLVDFLIYLFNQLAILIFGLALIMFFWGVAKSMLNTGDPKGRAEARKYLIFGVIAFTVMVGLWGIVQVLLGLFGLDTIGPQFPINHP